MLFSEQVNTNPLASLTSYWYNQIQIYWKNDSISYWGSHNVKNRGKCTTFAKPQQFISRTACHGIFNGGFNKEKPVKGLWVISTKDKNLWVEMINTNIHILKTFLRAIIKFLNVNEILNVFVHHIFFYSKYRIFMSIISLTIMKKQFIIINKWNAFIFLKWQIEKQNNSLSNLYEPPSFNKKINKK